jgi:hypothetical protein
LNSVSQLIVVSPRSLRSTSAEARWADFIAMVTPDENTGSRNSAALPSSA